MKRTICRDIPDLARQGNGDWHRVCSLRNWVYTHVDWGPGAGGLTTREYETRSLGRLIWLFDKDQAGVDCGGMATILCRIYNEFGYRAVQYVHGTQAWSHSVVLVEISHEGRRLIAIQDPTANVAFVRRNAEPLDIAELAALLMARQRSEIETAGPENPMPKDFLMGVDDSLNAHPEVDLVDERFLALPGARRKYRCTMSPASVQRDCGDAGTEFLVRKGLPRDYVYFMLHPYQFTYFEEKSKALAEELAALVTTLGEHSEVARVRPGK